MSLGPPAGARPMATPLRSEAAVFATPWWRVDCANPYRPGKSPFSAKGTLYRETRGFFDREYEGGMDAFLETIDDPDLRDFIGQPFLASALYDAMPLIKLIRAEARAMGQTPAAYLEARTHWQAKRDTAGVYAAMLKFASPGSVAKRLPALMVQVLDFANFELMGSERGRIWGDFRGVPAELAGWLCQVMRIYAHVTLTRAGARTVETVRGASHDEPAQLGIPMVGMECELRWT